MRTHLYLATALVAVALAGCGGGGGKGGSSATSQSARVGVFVTDDLGNYDHVWVTVKSVTLVGPSGAPPLYDDATGKTLDLASLHDTSGSLFAFLGLGGAPAGVYTSVKVVLDDDVVLFPAGATVGQARKFAGAIDGQKTLDVQVDDGGERIGGDDNLVVDFDLARWTDDGTLVTAVAKVGDHAGPDDSSRCRGEDNEGTVSGLSATGFTLTGKGLPVVVTTDANTTVFGGSGTLANGQHVKVRGVFSASSRTLTATSVKIEDGSGHDGKPEVRGTVATIGTASIYLTVDHADDFLPTSATVHVAFGANAEFRGAHGATLTQAAFLAALTTGEAVEAEGAYDAASNTLAATRLKVEAANEGGHGGGGDDGGGDDHGGGSGGHGGGGHDG